MASANSTERENIQAQMAPGCSPRSMHSLIRSWRPDNARDKNLHLKAVMPADADIHEFYTGAHQ